MFYTNSAVEYWGGGRAAALVHTSPDGKRDPALPANVRAYFLTGHAALARPFPAARGAGQQQPDNPLEYWWTLRALLVAMDRWVTRGRSRRRASIRSLADGTLVPAATVAFPAIPGVQVAAHRAIPGRTAGTRCRSW